MFNIGGTEYTLKYTLNRVEMIEKATDKPLMAELKQHNGLLSVFGLKMYLAYGLKKAENGSGFLNPKQGLDYATALMEQCDYSELIRAVLEALQQLRDRKSVV